MIVQTLHKDFWQVNREEVVREENEWQGRKVFKEKPDRQKEQYPRSRASVIDGVSCVRLTDRSQHKTVKFTYNSVLTMAIFLSLELFIEICNEPDLLSIFKYTWQVSGQK